MSPQRWLYHRQPKRTMSGNWEREEKNYFSFIIKSLQYHSEKPMSGAGTLEDLNQSPSRNGKYRRQTDPFTFLTYFFSAQPLREVCIANQNIGQRFFNIF